MNTCIGCTESMNDGLMENLRCDKCHNYDCYEEDAEMTEIKNVIYNQALNDLVQKIFEECVPLGTKDDSYCWFTKNRLRDIKSKLIK